MSVYEDCLLIFADVNPDQYKKQHGKAPPGYQFDPKKKKCVVVDKKKAAEWQKNQKKAAMKKANTKKPLVNKKPASKPAAKKAPQKSVAKSAQAVKKTAKENTKKFLKSGAGKKILKGEAISGSELKQSIQQETKGMSTKKKVAFILGAAAGVAAIAFGGYKLHKAGLDAKALEHVKAGASKMCEFAKNVLNKIKEKGGAGAEYVKNIPASIKENIAMHKENAKGAGMSGKEYVKEMGKEKLGNAKEWIKEKAGKAKDFAKKPIDRYKHKKAAKEAIKEMPEDPESWHTEVESSYGY